MKKLTAIIFFTISGFDHFAFAQIIQILRTEKRESISSARMYKLKR